MREFEEKARRGAQETETEMRLAKNSILAQLLHCFALLLIENLCPSCLFCLFLPLSLNICHSHAISLQYDTRPPAREEKKEGEKFKWEWMLRLLRIEIWTEIASDRRLSRNNPSLLLTLPHRPACALPARSLGRSLQFSSPHHFAPHIFCAPSPCLSYLVIHSASSLFLFLVRVFCEAKFAEDSHSRTVDNREIAYFATKKRTVLRLSIWLKGDERIEKNQRWKYVLGKSLKHQMMRTSIEAVWQWLEKENDTSKGKRKSWLTAQRLMQIRTSNRD